MEKKDIDKLELNFLQRLFLKMKLENSNFKVSNSNLETNVLKSEEKKHIQDLKNDKIKRIRKLQREASKQKLKDICCHKFTMLVTVAVSTYLSMQGLNISNCDNNIIKTAMLLFSIALALNAFLIQPLAIRHLQEFKKSAWTYILWSSVFLIIGGSIVSNWQFTKVLTNIDIINIILASVFDIVPLMINISVNDFKKKYNMENEEKTIEELEEKTGISNSQNTNVEQAKTEDEKQVIKTGQTAKNGENNPIEKIVKKQAKTEDEKQVKTLVKKPSVRRTSASKITFKNMQDTINGLPDGTIIKPKLVQMTGNSNYKTWIKKCQNVERDENNNYVKKSNVIPLERQG